MPSLQRVAASEGVEGMKKALSVSEAKQALGLGRTSLYKLIKQERIASVRIGRRRLILVESIDALLGGSPAN